ncbi:hypothetical protein EPO34_02650 [Patescibacteria group bacterium]|nr:MAG: hypothetical protein EPO34_02650 [Patescibacteria group bacterium]
MNQPLTVKIPIKDRDGRVVGEKEVATFAGLLNRAHEEGLKRIETKVVQFPHPDNGETAVVVAVVETAKGTFSGIGDANPGNVNRRIASCLIRMAETRAKARALRDAVNVGVLAAEELGDDGDGAEPPPRRASGQARQQPPRTSANGHRERELGDDGNHSGNGRDDLMTVPQRRMLYRLLSERGCEGEEATVKLREAAGVESTTQISKSTASRLIERYQSERDRPTENGHAR